ncbi:hypothetical protein NL676_018084 [Syzygium grande]|nr:hypothetical protein NL676_018084 [Syzygium grande]
MKGQSRTLVFSALLLSLLATALHVASTVPVEPEDESGFNYIPGSERGPENWGYLKEEWSACSEGQEQSPIDLAREDVDVIWGAGHLRRNYNPTKAYVMNRGHDIMLGWDERGAGSIKLHGRDYFLQQCHWHHPSEHAIDGRRYPLELHMVHLAAEAPHKIVVVGLLYEIGKRNAFINQVLGGIWPEMMTLREKIEVGRIDPRDIIKDGQSYYRYKGSLTTPPCTEGVVWIVNQKISSVSEDQIRLLRRLVGDGARAIPAVRGLARAEGIGGGRD